MSVFKKFLLTWLLTAIAIIPVGIWYAVFNVANPEGFWEKALVFGLGAYFLGGFQIILAISLVFGLYAIWKN